jgi:hypothetical protein
MVTALGAEVLVFAVANRRGPSSHHSEVCRWGAGCLCTAEAAQHRLPRAAPKGRRRTAAAGVGITVVLTCYLMPKLARKLNTKGVLHVFFCEKYTKLQLL